MVCETGAGIGSGMNQLEASVCYDGWAVDTDQFPAIKAICHWHSVATHDYQVTPSGRDDAEASLKAWHDLDWFQRNDPDDAP